jgi:pilus assembly protein CpaC
MASRAGLALALTLLLPGTVLAQASLPPAPASPRAPFPDLGRTPQVVQPPAAPVPLTVTLEAGTGRLLTLPRPALTVLAADPRVARIQPASPTSLFLMAVAPGRTTVLATAEDGAPVAQYDVVVSPSAAAAAAAAAAPQAMAMPGAAAAPAAPPRPTASAVEGMIRRMVRGADGVRVAAAGRNGFVLSGTVPTAADAQRAEAIARAAIGEDAELVNTLSLLSSIQVNLRVRVAEISRQVTRELGFNWQALAYDGNNFLLGLRTGTAGTVLNAITGAAASSSGAQRLAAGFSSSRFDINTVVDALASDQLITILAEPNLTAQSGEVASFLAGGEFPVPVAANNSNNSITVEFKQFGVSLAFVPTVMGPDRLNLRVRPEVSELSENGSISVPLASGTVTIPALTVRRAETSVELGSGQSFAIAGLLQRSNTLVSSGLNGLGDVPVLGALFRSDRFRRNESELVIIITPYLVRPVSDPRALAAPTDNFRPASDLDRILYRRQLARGGTAAPLGARLDAGFMVE